MPARITWHFRAAGLAPCMHPIHNRSRVPHTLHPQVAYTMFVLYETPSTGVGDLKEVTSRMLPFALTFSAVEAVGFMAGTSAHVGWSVGNSCMGLFLLGQSDRTSRACRWCVA